MWLVFYAFCFLVSAVYCLRWKLVSLCFVSVLMFYLVVMYLSYDEVNPFIFGMVIFMSIMFPTVCMLNAKILLESLKVIKENKDLLNMIKNIMNILPDGVIICSQNSQTETSKISFANNTVHELLKENENLVGKALSDINLRCKLTPEENE